MNYSTVKYIGSDTTSITYKFYHYIFIDDIKYRYHANIAGDGVCLCTVSAKDYISLNIDLLLNKDNPKETLDTFFKLLLLQ
jgi:hypothetical protein